MPTRYTSIPTDTRDDELEAAFNDSDDDEPQSRSLLPSTNRDLQSPPISNTGLIPGSYDFERLEYDFPPPGSPPRPSAVALPNSIGNTNGILPQQIVRPTPDQPGWFRRAFIRVLPARYAPLQTTDRTLGGGMENDGVFTNVVAKPTLPTRGSSSNPDEDGIYLVPEETRKDAPPSYETAAADRVPQYWETTVHAPPASSVPGEMIIDNLPTGTIFIFLWNMVISMAFQFIGFLMTYLLHTTHAAKFGSQAGLGITLLHFGFALRSQAEAKATDQAERFMEAIQAAQNEKAMDPYSNSTIYASSDMFPAGFNETEAANEVYAISESTTEWLSFFLMTLGWFCLLTAVLGFWRVKRWEKSILASTNAPPLTAEEREQANLTALNIERAFGLTGLVSLSRGSTRRRERRESEDDLEGIPEAVREQEERLRASLRAAGLV